LTAPASGFRILIVDDESEIAESLQGMLEKRLVDLGAIRFEIEDDFDEAERQLEQEQFDLVILDVKDTGGGTSGVDLEGRGRELYERIADVRWVPVIFYTGVPEQVRGIESPPLVRVVTKNRLPEITDAVRAALMSGVPSLTRRLGDLVDRQMREFLCREIAPNWSGMAESDQEEIALVLVHRLAAWLKENAVRELDNVLGDSGGSMIGHSSAARVYLKPPVTHHLTAADVVQNPDGEWWLVLTPACDLYEDPPSMNTGGRRKAKAEFVRLAKCHLLDESSMVVEWRQTGSGRNRVLEAFRTDHNRYRVLPKYLNIPNLLVDFEDVSSRPLNEVRQWNRIATLDSPFAEAMLTSHSRAVGRIGTPDINFDQVKVELGLKERKPQEKNVVPPARSSEHDSLADKDHS
jgi:CheY-like chemotaxis protein